MPGIRNLAAVAVTAAIVLASVEARSEETFADLKLRSIGPAVMGGRIDAVAVVNDKPWILYVGTASGGVFKTTNNGTSWNAVFDRAGTSSIGDVAVAPSDPEVVWVGTGEPNNRQSSSFGDGVYRSGDGGATWDHVGLVATQHIGKIIVHPTDPDHVFVAAIGGLWSANEERGVFRTKDGGKSWEKVLYVDENTGVVTMAIDPVNPDILYAAAYQRRRTPWGFVGGGASSGLYKTTDGGDTWRELTKGLPEGDKGRIGIDVFDGDPRLVYALIEHEDGGLYRSNDRGESWERVNELNPRPMYYSKLFLDPNDRDRIYVLGSSFHISDDGGASFRTNESMTPTYDIGVHGDHHVLWVDPDNSDHLILGNDGGLYSSWDRSVNWTKINNLPIAQFYAIAVDMSTPYNIYGGAQDTHSWGGPSATMNQIGILNGDWFQTNFGDGMYQQADPADPMTVYTESQGGNLIRLDARTGNRKTIKPYPEDDGADYRFHWTSPLRISQHDPTTLYFGGNRLFISRDRGDDWTATEDLTRAEDRDELEILGSVPGESTLSRHDGVSEWGTITTISESSLSASILYVGTDDGRIQLSRDGGENWDSIEGAIPRFDPLRAKVSRVAASHAKRERAYVSFDRHQLGDFAPHIFVTEDFGLSWKTIVSDLPKAGWVNVVIEHPRNQDLLFAGTETGLFVTFDRGGSWKRMTGNFPTVPVDDLVIHPRDNDLVVGTHGRSIYILDDITPLEQYRPRDPSVQLFDVREGSVFMPWKHESYGAQGQFVGQNPEYGALVTYFLPEELAEAPMLSVTDASGAEIRSLEGGKSAGFHRVAWDWRVSPPKGVRRGLGPLVTPGRYTVKLAAGETTRQAAIPVRLDARLDISTTELEQRFEFLTAVNASREKVQAVIERTEALEKQLEGIETIFVGEDRLEIREAASRLAEQIAAARKPLGGGSGRPDFRNPDLMRRLSGLFDEFSGDTVRQGSLHGPTPVQRARFEGLQKEVDAAIGSVDELLNTALPELNLKLEQASPLRIGTTTSS